MGVDIIAIGAGSVDKEQLLALTDQRSDKIFTGTVSYPYIGHDLFHLENVTGVGRGRVVGPGSTSR